MMTLPSGLSDAVDDGENVARFLTSSNHFNRTVVKPVAFLPDRIKNETSVSRHGREPTERLWTIGLEAAGIRILHGAAILKVKDVREVAPLDVCADEPPDLHAVIKGWPSSDEDPDLVKARQKEMALRLASKAGPPFLK